MSFELLKDTVKASSILYKWPVPGPRDPVTTHPIPGFLDSQTST